MKIRMTPGLRNTLFDVAIGLAALYAFERLVTLFIRTVGGNPRPHLSKFNWVMDKIDPTSTLMVNIVVVLFLSKRIFNTSFGKQGNNLDPLCIGENTGSIGSHVLRDHPDTRRALSDPRDTS